MENKQLEITSITLARSVVISLDYGDIIFRLGDFNSVTLSPEAALQIADWLKFFSEKAINEKAKYENN